MAVPKHEIVSLRAEEDIVRVRQLVRERARHLDIGLVDQTKIVTAASEVARNTVHYGGGGVLRLEALEQKGRGGLQLPSKTRGRGFPT
jgi:serine/threonine-protein kinase RsbT